MAELFGEAGEGETMKPESIEAAWKAMPYKQRLAATAYVFRKITAGPQSYRHLIYDRLGFRSDAYALLLGEGGMAITNIICDAYGEGEE